MKRACVFALILAGTPGLAARASAQTTLPLTLDEAVSRGLATSHRLAETVARGEAAAAAADMRRAAAAPQLSAQAGYMRTNHVEVFGVLLPNSPFMVIYPDIPNNVRTRLDLQWPIYTGGRLDALERAARAETAASTDDLATARSDLRLEITRAYWALVTATESLRVVDESVTRVDAHLRDVQNQFNVGLVPPNDVSSVEAQRSRQRMLSVQAGSMRDVAEAELGRLIGADPATPLEPVSPLAVPAPPPASMASLIDEARAGRSERAALVKRVNAADERRQAAAAGQKPTIAFAGGVDYARPNPRIFPRQGAWRSSWDAGVNVNWPIFDGGRTRAEIDESAAMERAVRERLADFDATLAVEVRQRLRELESSQAAIAAADDAVTSATEARRAVGDRFAAGVATSTDVLDAQVALLQAALDRTQAIAAARLASARLDRSLGR